MWTYKESLSYISKQLQAFSNAYQESYWILEFILKRDRIFIINHYHLQLSQKEQEELFRIVEKRKKNYPLQYLLGTVFFMGIELTVVPQVLIPREETSVIVEYILNNTPFSSRVLEIGVGAGTIALSLKKHREDLFILATDINPKAIECAQYNEKNIFGLNGKIDLKILNLLEGLEGDWDIIVSNPPYITEQEYRTSDKELLFEPKEALVAKEEGMFFYRKILEDGIKLLKESGFIILEISPLRLKQMILLVDSLKLSYQLLYDINHLERAIVIYKN